MIAGVTKYAIGTDGFWGANFYNSLSTPIAKIFYSFKVSWLKVYGKLGENISLLNLLGYSVLLSVFYSLSFQKFWFENDSAF